jgi:alpha-galactosidase
MKSILPRLAAQVSLLFFVLLVPGRSADAPQAAPEPGTTLIKLASKEIGLTYVVRKDQTLGIQELASLDRTWVSPLFGSLFPGKPARYGNGPRYQGPIAVLQNDGDTSFEPLYVSHISKQEAPGIEHLTITLRDRVLPVTVELHMRVYAEQNVFEQWQVITNGQQRSMRVPRLDSMYWQAKAEGALNLEWFESQEGKESGKLLREKLVLGNRLLESVDGCRHKSGPMPQFVLGFGDQLDETTGACMLSALAWSGNTRLSFSLNTAKKLETSVGVNEPGQPILEAGQSRSSPVCVSTFSAAGKGPASRNLHRWMRTYGLRDGNRIRPIDNNSWEGCQMNVSEAAVLEMMRLSADLGIELYVLDDGWFGDSRNLGDWWVNPKLFPNGLQKCIQEGKRLNIDFGIWFEPEMLNDGAKLAKEHPEWVMGIPGRELAKQRNQVTLDVANPAVQEFMFHAVDDTLKANPDIRMVKWDCNSNINNPYSPFLGPERQGDMLSRYFAGFYGVMQRLVTAHPQVDFQACAAGGGRADLGALRFAHTYWPSDNTDPSYRLGAVWNFSTHLPPMAATCHVTHAGGKAYQPKYRFDVAMMGQLGLEIDPRKSEPDYLAAAKVGIVAYKGVRDIIQLGDQYRHRNPADSTTPSLNYVSADRSRAVVLAYQTGEAKSEISATAPVAGLDPVRSYQISEINLPAGDEKPRLAPGTPMIQTGAEWMAQGVPLIFTRRYDSAALLLK